MEISFKYFKPFVYFNWGGGDLRHCLCKSFSPNSHTFVLYTVLFKAISMNDFFSGLQVTLEDCTEIAETCIQSGVILTVCHVLQYDPLIRKIKVNVLLFHFRHYLVLKRWFQERHRLPQWDLWINNYLYFSGAHRQRSHWRCHAYSTLGTSKIKLWYKNNLEFRLVRIYVYYPFVRWAFLTSLTPLWEEIGEMRQKALLLS